MRRLAITLALVAWPLAGAAQDRAETLADIRLQLGQLGTELAGLRAELMTTGAVARAGGADMLQRMEMVELELMRLTGTTEDLDLRINRIVADGTNRLGDLEFRVVELEGGDAGALQAPTPLGQVRGAAPAPVVPPPAAGTSDQADFDRARGVLGQGDFRTAADLFAAHAAAWPDSPLNGAALFLHAEALDGLGDQQGAAQGYLDSFSSYPDGAEAPEALFRLGRALGRLGEADDACLLLAEVAPRYPDNAGVIAAAEAERQALACP